MEYMVVGIEWILCYVIVTFIYPRLVERIMLYKVKKEDGKFSIVTGKRDMTGRALGAVAIVIILVALVICIKDFKDLPELCFAEKNIFMIAVCMVAIAINVMYTLRNFLEMAKQESGNVTKSTYKDYIDFYIGGPKIYLIYFAEVFSSSLCFMSIAGSILGINIEFATKLWVVTLIIMYVVKLISGIARCELVRKYDGLILFFKFGKRGHGETIEYKEDNGRTDIWVNGKRIGTAICKAGNIK